MLTRSAPARAAGQQKHRSASKPATYTSSSSRSIRSIARVAAPSKEEAAVAVDVDNAERARLESSDAFAELVALNDKKQSVNRPQKVSGPETVSRSNLCEVAERFLQPQAQCLCAACIG